MAQASGWFEWVPEPDEPKRKQPYYFQAVDGAPLFFAMLEEVHSGADIGKHDGFVIITAAAVGGLVDIHDRKPLVLPAEMARE